MMFKHLLSAAALAGVTFAVAVAQTVTVTTTVTQTSCPSASPSAHGLTGLYVGFGADPLVVTGSGNYLGYTTPSNVTTKSNSGAGYLAGKFAAAQQNGYFDVLNVAATVDVVPGASYTFSIAARHTSGNVFCFLYMSVGSSGGGRFNLLETWGTSTVFFMTSSSQTTVDVLAYSNCINGNNGPVVAYSVMYDDVKVQLA